MSWEDPFYRDMYSETDDPAMSPYANSYAKNPYAAVSDARSAHPRSADTRNRQESHAAMPEAGLRYEQHNIPATVSAPGCPCGSCPWRASAERGRAAIAMPTQSLDSRSDAAMGALLAGLLRVGGGATEGMTVPKPTREIAIVAQTLSLENFLIMFLFIIVVYLCITFTRRMSKLQKRLEEYTGRSTED